MPLSPRDHHNAYARTVAQLDVPRDPLARRVGKADEAQELQPAAGQFGGDILPVRQLHPAHRDHAQALLAHPDQLVPCCLALFRRHVAKRQQALGRALRGHEHPPVPAPHVAHHLEFVGEGVLAHEFARKQVLLRDAHLVTVAQHGLFHRVVGVHLAAQAHRLAQRVVVALRRPRLLHGHLVHGDGARLVHAKHADRAQRLDRGEFADQRILLREPPRAHGEEHRQNDGEFLGDHRHRQRDAGEHAFDQPRAQHVVGQIEIGDRADQREQHRRDPGAHLDQLARLLLKRRGILGRGRDVQADLAVLGRGADFVHLHHRRALRDQRARVAVVLAPVVGGGFHSAQRAFPHALGLAGQRALVHAQVARVQDHAIRGNLHALAQQHDVPRHQVDAGDVTLFSVADHTHMRRGQVLEGAQCLVGLPFLDDVDGDDAHDEDQHDRAVAGLAQHKVDHRRHQQQKKHRLGDDVQRFADEARLFLRGQLVASVLDLQLPGLFARQAVDGNTCVCHREHPPAAWA